MALYDGYDIGWLHSKHRGGHFTEELIKCRSEIIGPADSGEILSGANAMELLPGGAHEVYLFVNPGTTFTVTCRAYPKNGAGIGSVWLELSEVQSLDILASDNTVGHDAWETLSITYAATKHVYCLRLVNRTMPEGDARCWIDNVELN